MQLNKLFLKVTVCLFLAVLLFQSCADEEAPGVSPPAASSVKIKFSAFPASSAGDSLAERDDRLTSVKAWLFENGILSEVWEQIPFSGEGYELKLDKVSGQEFVIALAGNPNVGKSTVFIFRSAFMHYFLNSILLISPYVKSFRLHVYLGTIIFHLL